MIEWAQEELQFERECEVWEQIRDVRWFRNAVSWREWVAKQFVDDSPRYDITDLYPFPKLYGQAGKVKLK